MIEDGQIEMRGETAQWAVTGLGDGEMALLGVAQEKYYGLNDTAARIWELLKSEQTVDMICDVLVEEFDVSRDECEQATQRTIAELQAKNLVSEI